MACVMVSAVWLRTHWPALQFKDFFVAASHETFLMAKVTVKACPSPTCILLAFDWQDGAKHADFLGSAIQRVPGFATDEKPQFLFNKLDFVPIAEGAKPKGSNF